MMLRSLLALSLFYGGDGTCGAGTVCSTGGTASSPSLVQVKKSQGLGSTQSADEDAVDENVQGALNEARKRQMFSQNPNATEEACDACITAEDELVANLTALSTAQEELTAAQTTHQVATSAHATCETELAVAVSATSTAKASAQALHTSIGEYLSNDNAGSAAVAASGIHSLQVLLAAWKTAVTAQTTKASECEQNLASGTSNATAVQTKQAAVTDATNAKQTAESAAKSACATMRAKGYGAPCDAYTCTNGGTLKANADTITGADDVACCDATTTTTTTTQVCERFGGDSTGGTEQRIGSSVSTWDACVAMVRAQQPTASGVTYAHSHHWCFAEFGTITGMNVASDHSTCQFHQASLASVEATDISPTDASFADKTSDASHDKATDASPKKP